MSDRIVSYVRWGGKSASGEAQFALGYGLRPIPTKHGPRRALFDIAFGYASGFPTSAIAYYVLTRSLNSRIERWAMKREGVVFVGKYAVGRVIRSADTETER